MQIIPLKSKSKDATRDRVLHVGRILNLPLTNCGRRASCTTKGSIHACSQISYQQLKRVTYTAKIQPKALF